jgi:N-methylhydantoinase A
MTAIRRWRELPFVNVPLRDSAIRLSADVGGTFTDVAAFDENTGALRLGKTLTTPQRLVTGIESGVVKAGSQFSAARMFLHGTTVAINTILERSGAKCALLTIRTATRPMNSARRRL